MIILTDEMTKILFGLISLGIILAQFKPRCKENPKGYKKREPGYWNQAHHNIGLERVFISIYYM